MAQRSGVAGLTRMSVACIGTVAITILLFVATEYFPFALLALTGSGFAMLVTSTGIQTLVQSNVEGRILSRMLSVFNLILQGSPALGSLAIGTVSEWLGLRWPLAIGAVFCFLAWLWIFPQRGGIAAVMEHAVVPAHY